ncbi:MAG: hypothetical protein CM1200mP27_12420 [Chloroflexota bacterium]|nr:MAG: hypothetical protein CM1200mP27_12420 [Chloroflexota bacterium]
MVKNLLFRLTHLQNCTNDLVIASAAAEIARQPMTETVLLGIGFLI